MNIWIYAGLLSSIGLTIALYRVFLKLITIDKLLGMTFQGIVIFIVGLVLYYFWGTKNFDFKSLDTKSIIGISLAGTVLVINGFLIMTGLRMGLDLSNFTPAYAIMGNVFVVLIGLLFFKENINIYNIFGLILGMTGIYFLSLK